MDNDLSWIARGLKAAAEALVASQPVRGFEDDVRVVVKINKHGPVDVQLEGSVNSMRVDASNECKAGHHEIVNGRCKWCSEPEAIPMVTLTKDEIRVIMSAANIGWSEGGVSKLEEPVLATGLSKLKAMLRADAFASNELTVRKAFDTFCATLKKHVEGRSLHVSDWDECREVYGAGYMAAWKAALESMFK